MEQFAGSTRILRYVHAQLISLVIHSVVVQEYLHPHLNPNNLFNALILALTMVLVDNTVSNLFYYLNQQITNYLFNY